MIRLNIPKDPYWIDLLYDAKVRVRPLTTAVYSAAQSRAWQAVEKIRQEIKDLTEVGAQVSGLPDLTDSNNASGFYRQEFIRCLAISAILEWQGVADETGEKPAEITEQTVSDLMSIPTISEAFLSKYSDALDRLVTEGNGLPAAAPGTSGPAGKGSTAPPAKSKPSLVAEDSKA